jgi:hypothetical protein
MASRAPDHFAGGVRFLRSTGRTEGKPLRWLALLLLTHTGHSLKCGVAEGGSYNSIAQFVSARVLEATKLLRDSEWGEMACGDCDPRPGSLRAPPSGNRPVMRAFGWERAIVPCQR